jgi:hypothetical protein
MMSDHLYSGPSQLFKIYVPGSGDEQENHRQAEGQYTNINTFAVLMTRRHCSNALLAQDSPLRKCVDCAFAVFAFIEQVPTRILDISHTSRFVQRRLG